MLDVFARRTAPGIQVTREFTATRLNFVLNHPEVRPWVADTAAGVMDASPQVANLRNVLLGGEHGCILMVWLQPGIYEVHTQVLPEGRGAWALGLIRAAGHYMFTRTDCIEGMTRVPVENRAAKGLTLRSGMKFDFTRPDSEIRNGKLEDVDVFSFRIQDWVLRAPGLVEIGHDFHDWMQAKALELGTAVPFHEDDEGHNRNVGVCIEMAMHGQVEKAVNFYNRWALICRQRTIQLLSVAPAIIQFDIGCLRAVDDGLVMFRDAVEAFSWVASAKQS